MGAPENDGSCSRCECTATHVQGHQKLCPKHYRFGQMRASAKRRGLAVPSHEQLHGMTAKGLICPDCGKPMNWLGRDGQASVASLQHYRDGSLGIVCRSCNTRHAFAPADTYRDAEFGTKWCPCCRAYKAESDFTADNSRSGPRKIKSHCKQCSHDAQTAWRIKNREHYNAKQREGRARRAAAN